MLTLFMLDGLLCLTLFMLDGLSNSVLHSLPCVGQSHGL